MNREAAALMVPVYSIFRGKIGDVDRYLAESGRLILLEKVEDIHTKLAITKRSRPSGLPHANGRTLSSVVESIVEALNTCSDKSRPTTRKSGST
jgi:predicted glycosyltransferase